MNTNLTELVFILDRSGSMAGLEKDTIGGYNSFIEKQKSEEGEANLSTILFDSQYDLLHDRVNIKSVAPLTEKEYFVRGMTALIDALGIAIDAIGRRLSATPENERPGKVLFVITTDGLENASRKYTADKVREMIKHQRDVYKWEFLFLGANIDAVATAQNLGIQREMAVDYCCDSEGLEVSYNAVNNAVAKFRKEKCMDVKWKEEIEEDFKKRGKK